MPEDFAALFRLDIECGMPVSAVRNSVIRQLYALRQFSGETPQQREDAIHDIERFLQELPK